MSIWGTLIMIALGAIFIFTLKNIAQLRFRESELIDKGRNLRNMIWGVIAFTTLFFMTAEFADNLGIKVNCNAYQQKQTPEECTNLNE